MKIIKIKKKQPANKLATNRSCIFFEVFNTSWQTAANAVHFYWQLISNLSAAFGITFAHCLFIAISLAGRSWKKHFYICTREWAPSIRFDGNIFGKPIPYYSSILLYLLLDFFFLTVSWKDAGCGKRRDTKVFGCLYSHILYILYSFGAQKTTRTWSGRKSEKLNPSPVELHARNVNFWAKRRGGDSGVLRGRWVLVKE